MIRVLRRTVVSDYIFTLEGDATYLKAFEQEAISGAADTLPLTYLKSIDHWGKQMNEMRNEAPLSCNYLQW